MEGGGDGARRREQRLLLAFEQKNRSISRT